MNIFYCPLAVLNENCELDETEARHITTVLRKKEDEELYVFDGKGKLFTARIVSIGKKEMLVHVNKLVQVEENTQPRLHIAIAPPKNIERFEWFAEKVTEIGISEITPLICQRSERKELRMDRIEKVLLTACKQSLHLTIPKLNEPVKFGQFVASVNGNTRKYIGYGQENAIHLKDAYHGGFDMLMLIGPEGDFMKEEVVEAGKHEFEVVSLGKSRLRLETAALYAAMVFSLNNE